MRSEDIARSSDPSVPLYVQIKKALVRKVQSGEWQPGEKLPSERELQELFDASRTPVRVALEELELQGLIYRVQGRGSFVRTNEVDGALRKMISFGQILRQEGHELSAETLACALRPCDERIRRKMDLEVGDEVIYLRRLMFSDGEPIILFDHYLRPLLPMKLLEGGDFPSLQEILEREGLDPWESSQFITARLLTEPEATLLNVGTPFAALEIAQTNYSNSRDVIWYSDFLIRSDRYRYPVTLQKR